MGRIWLIQRLYWQTGQADLCDGSQQRPDESASSSSAVHLSFLLHRFSDKVKHIKILTKDGCFYIAESRLFKTVLVKVLARGFFNYQYGFMRYNFLKRLLRTGFGGVLPAVLAEGRVQQSWHHSTGPLQGTAEWKHAKGHYQGWQWWARLMNIQVLPQTAVMQLWFHFESRRWKLFRAFFYMFGAQHSF